MPALASVPLEPLPEAIQRIAAFMRGFSLEATRPGAADVAALRPIPPVTRIYLSAVPARPSEELIASATAIRAAGFEPVPHVAVRNFSSAAALDDFLSRLHAQANVRRILVIAGDRAHPAGPFRRAIDAIDGGLLRRRGLRAIGIAGYPDGHPHVSAQELMRSLAEKIDAAEQTGLAVEIVTQFCFDAAPIIDWIARVRDFGFDHPIRIGLAGPTNIARLLRYAARCGVRASAQGLARQAGLVRQIFALSAPDAIIRALAEARLGEIRPHFFSFGGLPATARWVDAVASGRVMLEAGGGFRVEPPQQRV
jgi:methylenetetrahydrofolate reductase (NADPH)